DRGPGLGLAGLEGLEAVGVARVRDVAVGHERVQPLLRLLDRLLGVVHRIALVAGAAAPDLLVAWGHRRRVGTGASLGRRGNGARTALPRTYVRDPGRRGGLGRIVVLALVLVRRLVGVLQVLVGVGRRGRRLPALLPLGLLAGRRLAEGLRPRRRSQ